MEREWKNDPRLRNGTCTLDNIKDPLNKAQQNKTFNSIFIKVMHIKKILPP